MILETDFNITALDEAETLRTTHINALLQFYVAKLSEDKYQIWYDINGKTPVKDYLPEHPSEADKIRERLKAVITEVTTDFNIPEDYLMITPDTIYVDDNGCMYLTYYPQIKSTAIIMSSQKMKEVLYYLYLNKTVEDGEAPNPFEDFLKKEYPNPDFMFYLVELTNPEIPIARDRSSYGWKLWTSYCSERNIKPE